MDTTRDIQVQGIVQGVGFRPFIYRLAQRFGLSGWVYNASDGVHIRVSGPGARVEAFINALQSEHPPAALITSLDVFDGERSTGGPADKHAIGHTKGSTTECAAEHAKEPFVILPSRYQEQTHTLVSGDLACCEACQRELFDAHNRRFHYPFINCTNCGPRFTIIQGLPYDRVNTSMSDFELCEQCAAEYADPLDRRFHAQPDACFDCGPVLEYWHPQTDTRMRGSDRAQSDAIIAAAAAALRAGQIVALKGVGGYHLACDALDSSAVRRLRLAKHRGRKPLACMVRDLDTARRSCEISEAEARLLSGPEAPIILLKPRSLASLAQNDEGSVSREVACGVSELGIMLPSTPLHHLLFAHIDHPLVMTSANISEEPIIASDLLAKQELAQVADVFIGNNRPIISAYDDSVLRVLPGQDTPQFIRRARGYAPRPLALSVSLAPGQAVLALGAEQKSTFCLSQGSQAFVSQHLGDLENANSFSNFKRTIELYQTLFATEPSHVACDLHPGYFSTQLAQERAAAEGLSLYEIQHHHAHIAAVLGEAGASVDQEVIGLAFDGTGWGPDETVWGGEVLISSLCAYRRFARLAHLPLVGGTAAIKHPARLAWAVLCQLGLEQHAGAAGLRNALVFADRQLIAQMIDNTVNTPPASSVGRLFDVISALCGICTEASYDGEAAMLLEAAAEAAGEAAMEEEPEAAGEKAATVEEKSATAREKAAIVEERPGPRASAYRFDLVPIAKSAHEADFAIDYASLLRSVLADLAGGRSVAHIAKGFHDALLAVSVKVCELARSHTGFDTVALSGGVFANRYLSERLPVLLEHSGFAVLTHKQLPSNDGCIAYGQAACVAAQLHMPV
ncbi:MAG: carbamoyltransferase HypF [Coriobacteriales bacterium]|nr:carbamoyltransferase HypF [Coriobacteriales bacterium]